ncbi:MAG: hypothetical protein O3C60_10090 [Planctomycetota bacterium]|nr:hypothetical protein [Planctomycetota bacterium]
MKSIENLKRTVRRFILRTAGLGILVVLGAMSIAHTQRENAARTKFAPPAEHNGRRTMAVAVRGELDPAEVPLAKQPPAGAPLGAPSDPDWSQDSQDALAASPADFGSAVNTLVDDHVAPVRGTDDMATDSTARIPTHDPQRNPLRGPPAEWGQGNESDATELPGYLPSDASSDDQLAEDDGSNGEAAVTPGDFGSGDAPETAPFAAYPLADPYPAKTSEGLPLTTSPNESELQEANGAEREPLQRSPVPSQSAFANSPPESYGSEATDTATTENPDAERSAWPNADENGSAARHESPTNSGNGSGTPGAKEYEGPQTPSIVLQKEMPPEVQVGQPARLALRIRNTGQVAAQNVVVRDQVPRGAKLVKTSPEAERETSGALLWHLGTLPPGKESIIEMHVEPIDEGRIGSVASVTFEANATGSTLVTKPNLTIEHTGPQQVMVGDLVRFAIQISNPGTGTAERVMLQEDVPPGLAHSAGQKLEYEVGSIRPGETRHLELTLKAAAAGPVDNVITARANGSLQVQHMTQVEVIAPGLRTRIEGPVRRFLNRNATYTVMLENPGTAAANNVDMTVQLPEGLQFVNTNNAGHYDSSRHAIRWNLATLPAKKRGKVQFTVVPVQMGDFKVQVSAQADLGLSDQQEHLVNVDGVPALLFSVADATDPIEVGGVTSYEIRVVNQGSKVASNVRLVAAVPDGLEAITAEGATDANVSPQNVEFRPVAQLLPQQEVKFRIDVRGVRDGDWRFAVSLTSDETTSPITKQESTHVYSDQ